MLSVFYNVNQAIASDPYLAPAAGAFRRLTEAERQASLETSMAGWTVGQDLWVYGYGSLIWRPDFEFLEQRPALLHGYHRALCLWSRVNRGTPEHPGLVFGLDIGGSCRGMAFRIPAHQVPATTEALWQREMPSGAYTPKWLSCRTDAGHVNALVFVMNRNTDAYVPALPPERLINIISTAHGSYGPCLEYVMETAKALRHYNIHDKRLQSLVHQLQGTLVA